MQNSPPEQPTSQQGHYRNTWLVGILLLFILLVAGYFRLSGIFWGEYEYLHPDERFLIWVGSDITPTLPVEGGEANEKQWISPGEYFDTANSPLNPNNRGHGFYVYGTLPLFFTRLVAELGFGHSGFDIMTQVGRVFSAVADLLTVLLVYLIGRRLFDWRVGILAAAFSAFVVMQIQQAHFFTMDAFLLFFMTLVFYIAVQISVDEREWEQSGGSRVRQFFSHPLFLNSLAFGIAYGMSMATKVNALPISLLLPAAVLIRILRFSPESRTRHFWSALGFMLLAGFTSLLVFRISQPYAFSGPGFFGLALNPQWLDGLKQLRDLTASGVDFPPAMQWARRSPLFSGQNLVVWGLGIPLGILAFAGFFASGWRILKGDWQRHALLWGWTAFYFTWQSFGRNPTMRYQLPVYPMLVILAAWALVALWDYGKRALKNGRLYQSLAVIAGAFVLVATLAYAYGFSRIYVRPITRLEASRWIFQNIPAAINLHIQGKGGMYNQPVPYPYDQWIYPASPYITTFRARQAGTLNEIYLPHVSSLSADDQPISVLLEIYDPASPDAPLTSSSLTADFPSGLQATGDAHTLLLDPPIALEQDDERVLKISIAGDAGNSFLTTQASLRLVTDQDQSIDTTLFPDAAVLQPGQAYTQEVNPPVDGEFSELYLSGSFIDPQTAIPVDLSLSVVDYIDGESSQELGLTHQPDQDNTQGPGLSYRFDQPLLVTAGERYTFTLRVAPRVTAISLSGSAVANEGDWDDGLPYRVDGFDAFGGIYTPELNFNMYWDDNPEKLERFVRILDETDYILISSNRQWGTLPRLPERFPMTSQYYRSLLGCPPDQTVLQCYRVAEPGMFTGELGFELVKVFESNSSIGPIQLNDQFAEEAFTVYDHPKVLIFQKTADYDPEKTRQILSSVDFSRIVRMAPLLADSYPATLTLPAERQAEQVSNGTWSELFDTEAIFNRYPILASLLWYLALTVLGLVAYPLIRLAFPGLPDRGFPLARLLGLLLLAYLAWLAGSLGIAYSRTTITLIFLLLAGLAVILGYTQRNEIVQEWKSNRRYFLVVEGLFLAFFVLDLLIRLGNPDLWHQWRGGERPMDFSYFNAVLRSTSFPPYDPWYAGGYLNYYYFGFVLVGTLVKWLGIVPSIAFNLILPTVFAIIALGAFSLAWNLYQAGKDRLEKLTRRPYWIGLAGALGMALLGNLGTPSLIQSGLVRLGAPGGTEIEKAGIFTSLGWLLQGIGKAITGTPLPLSLGDWYWIPSRAIPGNGDIDPITEFPFFTVLYSDPHAHLFALGIALLALTFALGIVLGRHRWRSWIGGAIAYLIGGMAIGALRPTNTWDFPAYLGIGVVAVGYTILRYANPAEVALFRSTLLSRLPAHLQNALLAIAGMALLVILSFVLFQPYTWWYGQGYTKIDLWYGTRTPLASYFKHWGLFLFLLVSWIVWETRQWMAQTPLSALAKLRPYRNAISLAITALLLATALLAVRLPGTESLPIGRGVQIAWLALPLAAWAAILLLRPQLPDAKRFVLFLVGSGLFLTLLVEIIVLVGDIGRMNTVFKFYLQVWTMFAVGAAAALGWLWDELAEWRPAWKTAWQIALAVLAAAAALYPLTASVGKIRDRMVTDAPHTLDSMEYMKHATYPSECGLMDLSQDYRAIRWLQENVAGSPVIVEANLRDLYQWGSRMSIYTGLPGVVGWEWHQQQQRALLPGSWVSERIAEITDFYTTPDVAHALRFLDKYGVAYIILGQLERCKYAGEGLDKFEAEDGGAWQEVYRDGETVIYQVNRLDQAVLPEPGAGGTQ